MRILCFLISIFVSFSALADKVHDIPASLKAEISASLSNEIILESGKEAEVVFKMVKRDNSPVLPDDLKIVHTQNIHALIIDRALGDYNHKHPIPTGVPGEYKFTFTPKTGNSYRLWLEITPEKSPHQYIMLNLSKDNSSNAVADSKELLENIAMQGKDKYKFKLSFDDKLTVGKASMGRVHVADIKNKPANNLQPVMGAFAHIVGFYGDFETVVHIHPMGKEPTSKDELGGPDLIFHIEPKQKGFLRLFAQVKINDEDLFVPFGVNVE